VLDRFGQIAPVLFVAGRWLLVCNGKAHDVGDKVRRRHGQATQACARCWWSTMLGKAPKRWRLRIDIGRKRSDVNDPGSRRDEPRIPAPALRPSALHPLLVRNDRRAEVHRALRRRHDPAPAPEGAQASLQTSSRARGCFYFTTCGWMMWNWLVSGLAVRATLLPVSMARPSHPDEASAVFDYARDEKMTLYSALRRSTSTRCASPA
jgi:acetoacetyl-CoA synthetase